MRIDRTERGGNTDGRFAILNFPLDGRNYVAHRGVQVHWDKLELATVQPAVLQQVQEQQIHVFRRAFDALKIIKTFAIEVSAHVLAQELGEAPDGTQRRSEIVRNGITESFQLAVHLGEVINPALQLAIQRFDLGFGGSAGRDVSRKNID